jgi:hypothetical protein
MRSVRTIHRPHRARADTVTRGETTEAGSTPP